MDKKFLKIAIEEAKKSSSPTGYCVGAVIIKDGKIISKAHSYENEKNYHAEELAIKKSNENLEGSTIYVSMEPCDLRRSKRKSCCDWIIESGIKKVVFGVYDPDKFLECKGVEKLQKAGIEVLHLKELEELCKEVAPKLYFHES